MSFEQRKDVINPPTHIVAILDESGSMQNKISDVLGGYNSFVKSQKSIKDGSTMSLYTFSNNVRRVFHHKDVQEVPELNGLTYSPNGMTALLDAVQQGILDAGEKKEVILLVITDGDENASRIATHESVKSLISAREELGWKVVYMGASVNAFKQAATFGFASASVGKFDESAVGYATMYGAADAVVRAYRSGNKGMHVNSLKQKDIDLAIFSNASIDTLATTQ